MNHQDEMIVEFDNRATFRQVLEWLGEEHVIYYLGGGRYRVERYWRQHVQRKPREVLP